MTSLSKHRKLHSFYDLLKKLIVTYHVSREARTRKKGERIRRKALALLHDIYSEAFQTNTSRAELDSLTEMIATLKTLDK